MTYVILLNLRIILFFINLLTKRFKKVFIGYFTISYIIVYSTIIIPDALSNVDNSIEFWVVKC